MKKGHDTCKNRLPDVNDINGGKKGKSIATGNIDGNSGTNTNTNTNTNTSNNSFNPYSNNDFTNHNIHNGESREKDFMKLEIPGYSHNEAFARAVVAAFAARRDPTIEEISDIKTAVSEAVTNAIIHGYENGTGPVYLSAVIAGHKLEVEVTDRGRGIEDVEKVRQPFYTTRPDMERSGMGFTIMESFMDEIDVFSGPGEGTTVRMVKNISSAEEEE